MIVEVISGVALLVILILLSSIVWGLQYKRKYQVLYKTFEENVLKRVKAERQVEDLENIAEHRKTTLDNVVGIILADKNQVPKAIKTMVVTEVKK